MQVPRNERVCQLARVDPTVIGVPGQRRHGHRPSERAPTDQARQPMQLETDSHIIGP
jgi:hypothetical protein